MKTKCLRERGGRKGGWGSQRLLSLGKTEEVNFGDLLLIRVTVDNGHVVYVSRKIRRILNVFITETTSEKVDALTLN